MPSTSGNLIFSGNHNGQFAAYDSRTGKELWAAPTQARVVAAPSTYTVDGQQQVAILVGARGLPPGHPEAFIEAFANVYAGVAEAVRARRRPTAVGFRDPRARGVVRPGGGGPERSIR